MSKVFILLGALVLLPAFVLAQSAPATPPPMPEPRMPRPPHQPSPQMMQMMQSMQQMMTLHRQFRAEVLGALTPAHRTLLETIIGQLVMSDQPDPRAAVSKLDASLSSSEKSKIVSARNSFFSKMQAMHKKMMGSQNRTPRAMPSPDAGRILLMTAMMRRMGLGMMRGGMMRVHHGFMEGPAMREPFMRQRHFDDLQPRIPPPMPPPMPVPSPAAT